MIYMHFFLKEENIASFFAVEQCIAHKTIRNYLYIRRNRNYRQNSLSRRTGRLKGKEKGPKRYATAAEDSRCWNFNFALLEFLIRVA